jgi:hypothetical protein
LIETDGLRISPQFRALVEARRNRRQIVAFERLEMPLRDLRLSGNSLERETSQFAGAPEPLTKAVAAYGSHRRYRSLRIRGLDRTDAGQMAFQRLGFVHKKNLAEF